MVGEELVVKVGKKQKKAAGTLLLCGEAAHVLALRN